MAEFKISKIRYTWKNVWETGIQYNKDDVVKYGGSTWVCIRQHIASQFNADLTYTVPGETNPSPAWVKMTGGTSIKGNWAPGTLYDPGDIALYSGSAYVCLTSHTSLSTFDASSSNWASYLSSTNFKGSWAQSTRYAAGDLVSYGGNIYKCIAGHTSGTTLQGLENNGASWEIYHIGGVFRGEFQSDYRYKENDLILYCGSLIKCIAGHQSQATINFVNWEIEAPGFSYETEWLESSYYGKGCVVRYGGYLYYAVENNVNQKPGQEGSTFWKLLSKGINYTGEWSSTGSYKTGDVVTRGGYVYVALQDRYFDGSTLDYLDSSNWEIVIPASNWRAGWAVDENYSVGDVVTYYGTAYKANTEHVSSMQDFPGDNGSGYNYWDVLLLAGPNQGLQSRGDLLTYDLSREGAGDGSTFGPTNVPIGEYKQVLSVDSNDSIIYTSWGGGQDIRFVSPNGVDAPDYGSDPFKPWKTIRYACEQAELGDPNVLTTIRIGNGVYEEVLPITIPKNTALVGGGNGFSHSGDLRSVTVKPNPRLKANVTADAQLVQSIYGRLKVILPQIIEGADVTKTEGNDRIQVKTVTSTPAMSTLLNGIVDQLSAYINKRVNNVGSLPTVSGSNTASTDLERLNAREVLSLNQDFIVGELVAHAYSVDLVEFDLESMTVGLVYLVNALRYDLLYPGNYKSIRHAEYVSNFLLGSADRSMFFVRDATGIRNMTLSGLVGTLLPLGQYELYQRPTGGTFVSLDPGWGPDDETVWISTRSPYIQNVTTIGSKAVGLKIDGALHNGGNRSAVANDFTQIIDDGFGAWVINKGRAELVSVFTYYAQIGYFSENGGVIRATNGNNSYGRFGSVASGNDNNETPQSAVVNNQINDAQVASALAGEVDDEILTLEFNNAGAQYTTATYSVVGSGTGASFLQEEFRDNAISTVRIAPNPITGDSAGGGGYILLGNNAQTGNQLTITISAADTRVEAELLGLRIIITSGTGTGQYGYVKAFNPLTKILTVYRESDDQPGWDHVVSGTPIVAVLNTTTTYRFEPRPIFSHPGFTPTQRSLVGSFTAANVVYGETTATYSGVTGSAGTGTTSGGVTPSNAVFTVVRNGRDYQVTLTNGGAGYKVGETVKLLGTSLGGKSPDNDIFVTVTGVTGGTSNAINAFVFDGVGISGKFVITGAASNVIQTSVNGGQTWTSATAMPSTGNWKVLASGNNKFISIRNGSNAAASSNDGSTWTARTMPSSKNWNSAAYGNGTFVAVAGDANAGAFSRNDGVSWTATTLPSGNNLLSSPNDFSVSPWVFFSPMVLGEANSTKAPDGTLTADTLSSTNAGSVYQDISITGTGTYTASKYIHTSSTCTDATLTFFFQGAVTQGISVRINPSTGALLAQSTSGGATLTGYGSENVGNGWYRVYVSGTGSNAGNTSGRIQLYSNITTADHTIVVWGAHVDGLGATVNAWVDIAAGKGKFLAVSSVNNVGAFGVYNADLTTISWLPVTIDAGIERSWVGVAYGAGKFVAISATGDVAYSLDGHIWRDGGPLPSPDGSTIMNWKSIRYGQGVFFATCDTGSQVIGADPTTGPTNFVATSENGISWTPRTMASSLSWKAVAFGNPDIVDNDSTLGNRTGVWVAVADTAASACNQIFTGERARGRCVVESGRIVQVKLWSSGSGYLTDPTLTIVDPNNTGDAYFENRRNDGVLGQPTRLSGGKRYRTSSTVVTVTGNGYADIIPTGKYVYIDNISVIPGPGAQIRFGNKPTVYTVQNVTSSSLNYNGTYLVNFRITPALTIEDNLQHATDVEIREKYSQVRLTGHDFLDIGTGNFEQTNYPDLYSGFFNSAPENEVVEVEGGRVFYTSTDQDGNFRVGELFAVEQATGIVTVSADFFDLTGLQELRLGGVRVGSGTVIREFSTDALFTQDSNNVIPTQRAIKAYLNNRLSVGGSSIQTPTITAGLIKLGPAEIDTTTLNTSIQFNEIVDFTGPTGISGHMLANAFYGRSFG